MSKSLAETVNFGNAVQTQAYNKAAKQVDTFVKSETAEQKLARSGKMQTAKALESLASLGNSVTSYQAQQAEERTEELRNSLATYVGQALNEVESGAVKHWSESQTVANMPVVLHMEMAKMVGKRQFLDSETAFLIELEENPEIQLEDQEYNKLIKKHFNYENDGTALGLLSNSTFNDYQSEFFSKQDVKRATYQRKDKVETLQEDAALRLDDYFRLGRTEEDYTKLEYRDGEQVAVVDKKAWSKVSDVNGDFSSKKWATLVSENILRNDSEDLKLSGLTPKQYKGVVQKAFLDMANALDMPELLEEVPSLYRSSEFNDKIIELEAVRSNAQHQKWVQEQAIKKQKRLDVELDAVEYAFEQSNNGQQLVDVFKAAEKGSAYYEAATDLNNKINKTVSKKMSKANAKRLASNIDQAIINGTPLIGLDGKPVLDVNADPIDVTDITKVRAYVMTLPNIWIDDSTDLIEGMDALFSAANLVENKYLLQGLTSVEELTSQRGKYRIRGDNQEVKDKFEELFIDNWKAAQAERPKSNIRSDITLQKAIMKDTLNEWKELPQWEETQDNEIKSAYEFNKGGQMSKNNHPNQKKKQMNEKQKELYFKMLEQAEDVEATKQKFRDKGYSLPN